MLIAGININYIKVHSNGYMYLYSPSSRATTWNKARDSIIHYGRDYRTSGSDFLPLNIAGVTHAFPRSISTATRSLAIASGHLIFVFA